MHQSSLLYSITISLCSFNRSICTSKRTELAHSIFLCSFSFPSPKSACIHPSQEQQLPPSPCFPCATASEKDGRAGPPEAAGHARRALSCCTGKLPWTSTPPLPWTSTPTTPAGAAVAYDDVDDRKTEECVADVPPTEAASGRTPTPSSCCLALPSVHLAHDVFDGMPERPIEPIGFPGAEETSQKIKYDYGNYDNYLLTDVHA